MTWSGTTKRFQSFCPLWPMPVLRGPRLVHLPKGPSVKFGAAASILPSSLLSLTASSPESQNDNMGVLASYRTGEDHYCAPVTMETPSTNKYLNKDEEQAPLKRCMYFYLMLKEFEASARKLCRQSPALFKGTLLLFDCVIS